MGSRLAVQWLAVVVIAAICGACDFLPLHEAAETLTCEYVPGRALQVESVNGSISVKRADRQDVRIVAHLRATSAERLEAAEVLTETSEQGLLSIRIGWPQGRRLNREGCSFEISVPGGEGIRLQSSNGKLVVSGLGGMAELITSNGEIEIENHRGPVSCRTSNGNIALAEVSGAIDAQSSNGNLVIAGAGGPVKANTSNGTIRIGLASTSPGPIEAQTSNGLVELELGAAFSGRLSLKTSNGSINVDKLESGQILSSGKNRLELAFADADHRSTVATSNGQIRLRSSSGPAPAE